MPQVKKDSIKRKPVNSTNIVGVGYEASTQTLDVEFYSGTLYRYANVPPVIHENFMNASSKGSYFQKNIAREFTYKKIV